MKVTTPAEAVAYLASLSPSSIKLGLDPTAPDIHLGHTVILTKLRQFQDQGHHVLFLIGDFTGRIGDPSGKSSERNMLSEETLEYNATKLRQQLGQFLDFDTPVNPESTVNDTNPSESLDNRVIIPKRQIGTEMPDENEKYTHGYPHNSHSEIHNTTHADHPFLS